MVVSLLRRALGAVTLAAALVTAACGDNAIAVVEVPDAAPPLDIVAALNALPGVRAIERVSSEPGTRTIRIEVDQPVDHDDPGKGTFVQHLTLVHRDPAAPMILATTGYNDYYGDYQVELTGELQANQVIIEHRYFLPSRPSPADWTLLTIAQAAADHHHVVELLKPLYRGPWISTGASKGGMTSIYHRRFYPDDVDGTVAYVAPISFGAPDPRYTPFVDAIGTAGCRDALAAISIEMLAHRRAMLETRAAAQLGHSYTRIKLGPAVESAVDSLAWAFWQYGGVSHCPSVPAPSASDDAVWAFLTAWSPVSDSDDASTQQFEPYYFQAAWQLGFPVGDDAFLQPYLIYGAADYAGITPLGVAIPAYDPTVMQDIDTWVRTEGDRILFIYGEFDPWTGGAFDLGTNPGLARFVAPEGNHGSGLLQLSPADRATAYATLTEWTGVTPVSAGATARARRPIERVPPAALSALRLRAR
ncbi:MAG: peptidase [Deltaproteobacteria bacterium]|nr:peptidase [Deltaproteobacteria bacterium]